MLLVDNTPPPLRPNTSSQRCLVFIFSSGAFAWFSRLYQWNPWSRGAISVAGGLSCCVMRVLEGRFESICAKNEQSIHYSLRGGTCPLAAAQARTFPSLVRRGQSQEQTGLQAFWPQQRQAVHVGAKEQGSQCEDHSPSLRNTELWILKGIGRLQLGSKWKPKRQRLTSLNILIKTNLPTTRLVQLGLGVSCRL